jgi:hypothetical protein
MEIPVQLIAAGFSAVLLLQGWQVRMLYRLSDRLSAVEHCLEFNELKLPSVRA